MNATFFGTKQNMSEAFIGESRVAVTRIDLYPMKVAAVKDGSTQVVFGPAKKHPTKAIMGHLKKSGVTSGVVREVPAIDSAEVGASVAADSLQPGAKVSVQGKTKGKGFAGVIKRHGFAGGPRTHGQSDRHRAPGSIGQGTTPGRVHRGKKMAGRMGGDMQSIKNMTVVAVQGNSIWVTGPVPGARNSMVRLTVTGQGDAPELTFLNGLAPVTSSSTDVPAETPAEPAGESAAAEENTQESEKSEETKE